MSNSQAFSRAVYATALVLMACAAGSCSSRPGGGQAGSGATGGTGLDAALSQVADTPGTRAYITFDDTARLVHLSGTSPFPTKGFALLRGFGASSLAGLTPELASQTGISLFSEDYAITADNPPRMLTLLHGGQSATLVTSRLTKLGWKRGAGMLLIGPPVFTGGASQKALPYAVPLQVVQPDGHDLTFGDSGADLSQIGSPTGPTLASDPVIRALAGCLGDVVAAQISVGGDLGGRHPAAVAIGVRSPARNTAIPHVVACAAWPGKAQAARYVADVRKALSTGLSAVWNQPFSALLSHASVTSIGGSQHIIEWQADTPGHLPYLIFQLYMHADLPALPDCAKVPAAARSRVIGCP